MAIPDFQSIMLPLLIHLADGKEHDNKETFNELGKFFNLSDEELKMLLPSGRQGLFTNRIAWAKSHLKGAGLIESPKRAHYKITDRGKKVLKSNPDKISISFLRRFPEYERYRQPRDEKDQKDRRMDEMEGDETNEMTPQEHIEYGYQNIHDELAKDILEKIRKVDYDFFEKIVVELLVSMGYGGSLHDAGKTIGKSGDEGIDGVIKEDKLGLDVIYIQAKRWNNTVGRPEIQKFAGALQGKRARKGVFITTSNFSREAMLYASMIENKIVLIDGKRLAELMIDHGIGVSPVSSYEIKRLDSDYFEPS